MKIVFNSVNKFGKVSGPSHKYQLSGNSINISMEFCPKILTWVHEKIPPVSVECFPIWATNQKKALRERFPGTPHCVCCTAHRVRVGLKIYILGLFSIFKMVFLEKRPSKTFLQKDRGLSQFSLTIRVFHHRITLV